jgi:hypothetical protein
MTKWICKGCRYRRCYVDDPNERIVPNQCPDKGITNPCWKRDCTTEEKKDELPEGVDWRMTTHYNAKRINDVDKKVKELITAGQGQMARIQALEKEVARSTDSYLQKQIDALDKKIDDLEGKYRAHSHIYGTHQWDQYTSQPRYMG